MIPVILTVVTVVGNSSITRHYTNGITWGEVGKSGRVSMVMHSIG